MKEEYKIIEEKLKKNYSIKNKTTFLIGGNVEYFIETINIEEILLAIKFAKENDLPIIILGRGSDILFPDEDLRAMVIHINESFIKEEKPGYYKVAAGTNLNKFIFEATENTWSGMESLVGIPGSIGGAVWANAGAYGTEMKSFVDKISVIWLDTENLEIQTLNNKECEFSYRNSIFKERKGVILDIYLKLEEKVDSWEETKAGMLKILQSRQEKHPLNYPNAGSTFKNILVTDDMQKSLETDFSYNKIPAGWLIEQVGLKGHQIGGAAFSEKHANFIVNLGDAKASDVLDLIALAKEKVKEKFDINIEEELIYVGK